MGKAGSVVSMLMSKSEDPRRKEMFKGGNEFCERVQCGLKEGIENFGAAEDLVRVEDNAGR